MGDDAEIGIPDRGWRATPMVTSISTLLVLVVVLLWRATLQAWIQTPPMFVVLLQGQT